MRPFAGSGTVLVEGMLAGISATFGLELSKAFLTTLVTSAAGGTAATFAGRAMVANLMKLFPGAGTLAGGAIAATTAIALTTALGESYISALVYVFEKEAGESPSSDAVLEAFRQRLMLKSANAS